MEGFPMSFCVVPADFASRRVPGEQREFIRPVAPVSNPFGGGAGPDEKIFVVIPRYNF
jgi:hypothetical protein